MVKGQGRERNKGVKIGRVGRFRKGIRLKDYSKFQSCAEENVVGKVAWFDMGSGYERPSDSS